MAGTTLQRVKLSSIASEAGVSVGSVSSVLNNRCLERRIPQKTARLIRETAAKLGYLPNISARRLRSSGGAKDSVLFALISSFEAPIPLINHFITALRVAAESSSHAAQYSFSLMIEMFYAGHLREMPGLLTGDHFNAAIILNTTPEDDLFLQRSHLPFPVVLVNRIIAGYSSVGESPDAGIRAAEILAERQRSRLAVLHGTPLVQITRGRVDGFIRSATELLGRAPTEIIGKGLSEEAGYLAMREFLEVGNKIDGLYTVSDALALGAYRAFKEFKIRVPADVAVIGVGDYEISPFFSPPLSTVGVSHQKLAEQACQRLMAQLKVGGEKVPESEAVPVIEHLRESTGHFVAEKN